MDKEMRIEEFSSSWFCVFVWKIENFSMLPYRNREELKSPEFTVGNSGETKWHLGLQLHRKDITAISVGLRRGDLDVNNSIYHPRMKYFACLSIVPVDGSAEKEIPLTVDMDGRIQGCLQFPLDDDIETMYLPRDVLTIRYKVFNPPQEQLTYSSFCCKTTVNISSTVFSFPFAKIGELLEGKALAICFDHNNLEDTLPLRFMLHINKDLEADHVQIKIIPSRPSNTKDFFVKCKITVVCADKKDQTSQEDFHLFSRPSENDVWHFPAFILIRNLAAGLYTYVENTMYLQCKLTYSHKGDERHSWLPMCHESGLPGILTPNIRKDLPVNELFKGVQDLFANGEFCDVEIRIGGESFSCHKLVLCAQSPVFNKMFNGNFEEKRTGIVPITDLDPPTFKWLLKFLYSELIEDGLSVEDLCKLYSAAGKYEVLSLQRKCAVLLVLELSVTNICLVLTTADGYQDNFLYTHIYTYLRNHSKETFYSPQWKEFMVDNPTLSKETMLKILMEEPLA